MNKLLFFFLVSLNFSQAQCPVDLTLSTQAKINDFPSDYPGCHKLDGYLKITEYGSNITNLDSLSILDSIVGNFETQYCFGLNSLNGLNNLDFIGGDFIIKENTTLENLVELDNLKAIGGSIVIYDNEKLKSLNGLQQIATAANIQIELNDSLNSLEGLNNLDSTGNFIIKNNPLVLTLNGIQNLQYTEDFELISLHGLVNLNGINRLKSTRDFELRQCDNITSMLGVDSLTTVDRYFEVFDNKKLETLGCPRLKKIGASLTVYYNENLKNLNGPSELDSVLTIISIRKNDCDTLDLQGIGVKYCNELEIEDNNGIITAGFDSLKVVNSRLNYAENIFLCDTLLGLESLNTVDQFYFSYNDSVKVLNIANGDLSINQFRLNNNFKLLNVIGFRNLKNVNSGLTIEFNTYLHSIEGLSSIDSIGGIFKLKYNKKLKSIANFNSIEYQNLTNLYIQWSDSIESCSVSFICDYLSEPTNPYSLSSSNGAGCVTRDEILAECIITSNKHLTSIPLNIYPNPSTGKVLIKNASNEKIEVNIYNMQNQIVQSHSGNSQYSIKLDIPGLYIIRCKTDELFFVNKILIKK